MKRRSCSSTGRPCHAGCFWRVRNDPRLALSLDDLFHRGGAESADQLVLQVRVAHVEAEQLQVGAGEVGAEARPLETAPELALLGGVAQACQPEVEPGGAVPLQEAPDRLRAADRHDGDALGVEIPAAALGQRLERGLVADPFDEHDRLHVHGRIFPVAERESDASRGQRDAALVRRRRRRARDERPDDAGAADRRPVARRPRQLRPLGTSSPTSPGSRRSRRSSTWTCGATAAPSGATRRHGASSSVRTTSVCSATQSASVGPSSTATHSAGTWR